MSTTDYSDSGALISLDGKYRFRLWREWDEDNLSSRVPYVLWIMLNPSTADSKQNDPTIRRCIGFTDSFGYKRLEVVNLFAYRATKPKVLIQAFRKNDDVVGPGNLELTDKLAYSASLVIAAWGGNGNIINHRGSMMKDWLRSRPKSRNVTYSLGLTAGGQPKHPLFVPANKALEPLR